MKRFLHYFSPAAVHLRMTVLVASALVVGCSSGEHEDLRIYVNKVKSREARPIPPLPEFASYETYAYMSALLRDPFAPREEATVTSAKGASTSNVRPDENRNKEALESFPLDGLQFVGLLEKKGQTWAIVKAPDKLVHPVQVGNHLGQNYGKVVGITEAQIDIVEIVPDGLGGWIKREASLAITE